MIEIENFSAQSVAAGYCAHFDVAVPGGILIRRLALLRPEQSPRKVWLVMPMLERRSKDPRKTSRSVTLTPEARGTIGNMAAAMYVEATGIDIRFAQEPKNGPGDNDEVADDYARLRRVIGAAEAETLARAGL